MGSEMCIRDSCHTLRLALRFPLRFAFRFLGSSEIGHADALYGMFTRRTLFIGVQEAQSAPDRLYICRSAAGDVCPIRMPWNSAPECLGKSL